MGSGYDPPSPARPRRRDARGVGREAVAEGGAVAVTRYEVLGPQDDGRFRVLARYDDGDGEYVRSGPRDFCESEMVRLTVKALLSEKRVVIKALPFLLHPPTAS